MKKITVFSLTLLILFPTWAKNKNGLVNFNQQSFFMLALPDLSNLDWQVGEYQKRQAKKGALRVGRLESWVDREEGDAVWLINEVKILFKKKQIVEALIERKTGKILEYIVDGEDKTPPDITEIDKCESLSETQETIRVPAGQYPTLRSVIRCDEDIMALWTNSEEVTMGGFIQQAVLKDAEDPKSVEYIIELTEFGKN